MKGRVCIARRFRGICFAALALLAVIGAAAWLVWPGNAPLADAVSDFAASEGLSGGVIAEGKAGTPPRVTAFGHIDGRKDRPIRPGDRFRIASLSKPLTAAAVVEAASTRNIDLDSPVAGFLPQLKEGRDPRFADITLLDLLRHSGGWDRIEDGDPVAMTDRERARYFGTGRSRAPRTCGTMANGMLSRALQFDPGSRYEYSNIGYCWLGLWLTAATDEGYEKAVHALIPQSRTFSLDQSTLDVQPRVSRDEAALPVMNAEAIGPAGGWIGDAAAYYAFAARPVADVQLARPAFADGPEYYGLGWRVWNMDGTRYLTHFGALPGVFTVVIKRDDGRLAVMFFSGRPKDDGAAFDDLFRRVRNARDW